MIYKTVTVPELCVNHETGKIDKIRFMFFYVHNKINLMPLLLAIVRLRQECGQANEADKQRCCVHTALCCCILALHAADRGL
jgi:hypothetical protein